LEKQQIVEIVVRAIKTANLGRTAEQQLEATPTAVLFGAPSPLDSLGLVGLLIDIEEAFQHQGHSIVLSDERAMSERRSPFRDVPSLTAYIEKLISGGAA
jgi:acyl carrier protein